MYGRLFQFKLVSSARDGALKLLMRGLPTDLVLRTRNCFLVF